MATEWFYSSKGQKHGPISYQELRRLAKEGVLLPTDLLWKDGMKEWSPASHAQGLFGNVETSVPHSSSQESESVSKEPDNEPSRSDQKFSVREPIVAAAFAAAGLHTLSWLTGNGFGSMWGLFSSSVLLACGLVPLMKPKTETDARVLPFGAGVGAGCGAVYGLLTGGILPGILFGSSVGMGAAWCAGLKGVTTKAAQSGVIVVALAAFHLIGMLPWSARHESQSQIGSVPASHTKTDDTNPDFKEGYDAGMTSAGMSPQERGQFLMSLEPQIPKKKDPKAFRRGMAKAFKERTNAVEAYNEEQKRAASGRPDGSPDPSPLMKKLLASYTSKGFAVHRVSSRGLSFINKIVDHAVAIKRDGDDHNVVCLMECEPFSGEKADYNALQTLAIDAHRIMCERRSKSAARGGVGRPVEKCSAQPCSGVGQENRGGAAISPYRERGTRSVCSDGDVD